MSDRYSIGIDFGGTKILAGVVNTKTGKLVSTAKKKTKQANDQKEVMKRLESVVDEALDASGLDARQIDGIGIGAAGMVDRSKGILLAAANIGAYNLKLTEPLARHYGVPAVIGNDVEVATIGELHFGAGKGCDDFLCVFVGTGIGSGIVAGGALRRGATGTAGEIGHTVLFPDGRNCGCGGNGCLEAYASRTAIAKQIVGGIKRGRVSPIADKIDESKGILRSRVLSQAIADGDEVVTEAITDAARYLAIGLSSVVNFVNPGRIIVGGGLVEQVSLYFDVVVEELTNRCLPIPREGLDIRMTKLGDFAGITGAAVLASSNGTAR